MELLSATQARLQEDLRGLARCDARCDDVIRQLYSFDGSPFEERPRAVVWPRGAQDVAAVMAYASETGIPAHPRGAGTSATASAIGSGIVLDFSRGMRRVLQAGDDFVRVQSGAIRERVNEQHRTSKGRFFAPSAGHVPTSTLGSILSVDNVGPRWLRYGSPHESALELKIVSASGEIWNLRPFRARLNSLTSDPVLFRRRFLNAARAEANAEAMETGSLRFDRAFDAELQSSSASSRAREFQIEDESQVRSFRSESARELFFLRAFGDDAREVRAMIRRDPWASALGVIREFEPYLDEEQRSRYPLRCGYALRDVVRLGFDPTRFFTGSEGTLGIIAEAKLATFPVPAAKGSAIFLFESVDAAARATGALIDYELTLCDLLDSRVISLIRDWDSRFETVFPQGAQAALVVEIDSDSDAELRTRMDDIQRLARAELSSFGCWTAYSREERDLFRDLLQKSSCARLRMAPSFQTFPYWEDAQVPVESAPDFLRDVQALFKRERIVYSVGGFISCGHISVHPVLPYSGDEERRAFALSDEFEDVVLKYRGEIGFAKGNGRVRTAALLKRFPKLCPAFVRIKDVFDPKNLLSPDCVVSPDMRRTAYEGDAPAHDVLPAGVAYDDDILAPEADAALRESSLRSGTVRRREPFDLEQLERIRKIDWLNRPKRSQLEFQIAWNPNLVYAASLQCTGCGRCRIRTAETRLCPAFRHTPDEQASCRAKANILRGALDGELSLDALIHEEGRRIAKRCVRCHSCSVECPAQVDAAKLAFRLKSAYAAANGLTASELFALKMDAVLSVASRFAPLVNSALKRKSFRWALEKIFGIATGRAIPQLTSRSVLRRIARERRRRDAEPPELSVFESEPGAETTAAPAVLRPRRKVALLTDTWANYFDPQLFDAALAVLERNGVEVRPLLRPRSTGLIPFELGDVDGAEEAAQRGVSILREAMRDGSDVVTLEPASAVCIRSEYPYFCEDADARAVCENAVDIFTYLDGLRRAGEFNTSDLRALGEEPTLLGYHAPCRSMALSGAALAAPTRAQELLQLIPGAEIRRFERGCCGMGGYSGFTAERYSESLRLGSRLFLAIRKPELDFCTSECSFCCLQLAQGGTKPAVHSLKVLAAAYGLFLRQEAVLNCSTVRSRRREK